MAEGSRDVAVSRTTPAAGSSRSGHNCLACAQSSARISATARARAPGRRVREQRPQQPGVRGVPTLGQPDERAGRQFGVVRCRAPLPVSGRRVTSLSAHTAAHTRSFATFTTRIAATGNDQLMTFSDPSAGHHTATFPQLRDWGLIWDTYDAAVHGAHRMPHFYTVARHENWWGSAVQMDVLLVLAKEHGIPVAWITPAQTLSSLAATGADHDDKLAVLVDSEDGIQALCRLKLEECTDEWIAGEVEAGEKAMAAWSDGHREAAACLAVAGVEQMLHNLTHVPRGRGAHKRLQKAGTKKPNDYLPKHQYVLAPLNAFYTPYDPGKGDAVPTTLSRHAVVHHLPLSHLSPGHCIIAVMLLISIIRETQERYDGIRDDLLMQASD